MSNLFTQLNTSLEGSDFTQKLTGQIGNLASLIDLVTGLVNDPPNSLGDLVQVLDEIELPNLGSDLGVDTGFASVLNSIGDVLPADLSQVTGGLTSGLNELGASISADIAGELSATIQAARAIYDLIQLDWTCKDGSTSATGSSGPDSGSDPGNNSDTEEEEQSATESLSASMDQLDSMLNLLPDPVNIKSILPLIIDSINKISRMIPVPIAIPGFNDIFEPLDIIVSWDRMEEADFAAFISDTFSETADLIKDSLRAGINSLKTGFTDQINGPAQVAVLEPVAENLASGIDALISVVESGDPAGSDILVAGLESSLDQYDTIKSSLPADFFDNARVLNQSIKSLVDDLQDQIESVIIAVSPGRVLEDLDPLLAKLEFQPGSAEIEKLEELLDTIFGWLQELVNKIDLTAIQEPLETAVNTAESAVGEIDNLMVGVTLNVQELFGQLESLIDQVDPQALIAQVTEEINTFGEEISGQMESLLAPINAAVSALVSNVGSAVDQFNPADLVIALETVFTSIQSLLNPALQSVDEIRQAIESAVDALNNLSFAPLADQVIDSIDDVTESLDSIDKATLNTMLEMALDTAVAILPADLEPLVQPLITGMGEVIEGENGPVAIINPVKDKPAELLDKIKEYDPAVLIQDALTDNYTAVLTQMKEFSPGNLIIEPMEQVLNALKQRLTDEVQPSKLLKPLEQVFEQIKESFSALEPAELIEPLNQAVTNAINTVIDLLPLDEIDAAMEQVDKVLKKIEEFVGTGDKIKSVFQKIRDILNNLTDADQQIDNWIDEIIGKLDLSGVQSTINAALSELSDAVSAVKADDLKNYINQEFDEILDSFDTLNPDIFLTDIVQKYRRLETGVNALPDSSEKTVITDLLARLNPMQEGFLGPFQVYANIKENITTVKQGLEAAFETWDTQYHHPESIFSNLGYESLNTDQLKDMIRETIEPVLKKPLKALFSWIQPVSDAIIAFLGKIEPLIDSLQDKIAVLLLGPEALDRINDSIQSLADRLRNLDFGFITASVESIFNEIETKIESLNPAVIGSALDQAFADFLETIDVTLLISQSDIDQLDSDFEEVIAKLEALNPDTLVVQPLSEIYNNNILPLINAFDISEVIDAIVSRLKELDDELETELGRVNQEYVEMLAAVP